MPITDIHIPIKIHPIDLSKTPSTVSSRHRGDERLLLIYITANSGKGKHVGGRVGVTS